MLAQSTYSASQKSLDKLPIIVTCTPNAGDMPAVSIIIPVYNTAGYISEALESVFAQTFTDFEVIVINDGSSDTDKLEKVLELYLERIVYLKQENRGPSAARNAGIRRARGEFIAFLDSDDTWLPEYLSKQIKCFASSAELNMVYSDTWLYGQSPLSGKSYFQAFPPKSPANFQNLLNYGSVLTSCVVVRKRVLLEVGLFDEELILLEDIHVWLRIAHTGLISCNKQILARHRYRPCSLSHVTDGEMTEAQLRVMEKLGTSFKLTAEERSALDRESRQIQIDLETKQAKRFLSSGDFRQAIDSLRRVNTNRRSAKLQCTIYGLRVAPHLTRSMANVWQGLLNLADNMGMVRSRERFVDEK